MNSSSSPIMSGTMNWEPVRKRLLGTDVMDALKAATELRDNISLTHTPEFPLMLSALLPAFSSVLAQRRPSPDKTSIDHKYRNLILDIITKMPKNEVLRLHAPHLVAVAIDVLNRDYEENALLASRIVFDLFKVYRSLPQDNVQPYLDFVVSGYRALPGAIERNFAPPLLIGSPPPKDTLMAPEGSEPEKMEVDTTESETKLSTPGAPSGGASVDSSGTSSFSPSLSSPFPGPNLSVKANASFRVLTECPLTVMLMFQLYPRFVKSNISTLIKVMMEALGLRAPSLESVAPQGAKPDGSLRRIYHARARELIAAQAKTLSFLTYLLRNFSSELKPYEERLATNVVSLMRACPRESIATRKELLVATRHLLNSEFRNGFIRHIDSLLDERLLMGSHHRYSDQVHLRPLGYTTLSDLVQHFRSILTMPQMSRVVGVFSRVIHDTAAPLPISAQFIAVRALLNVVDTIYHNKDQNPQIGRDLLVRILHTLVDKLEALNDYFPIVMQSEKERAVRENGDVSLFVDNPASDAIRDLRSMVRAIMVGHKTVIFYITSYRLQREKEKGRDQHLPTASNEEVSSAMSRMTKTEAALIDKYILAAIPALKYLKEDVVTVQKMNGNDKSNPELQQYRDGLSYFAAAFACLDPYNLRRTLGKRLDVLVDAIVEDPTMMVIPRHLLGSNPSTSFEFSSLLLEYLVERMSLLVESSETKVIFIDPPPNGPPCGRKNVRKSVETRLQRPVEGPDSIKKKSNTILQLFERVFKSLSVYRDNEAVIRRHLRRMVSVALCTAMEHADSWPENNCMLLRYIFRSVSAGKFEESYKELLPLIPTVLNGLYRIVCASDDTIVRYTAIELCLTIPARLSSLLPHMNLLIRVIIPALDSTSGDLVNLGLRTLEFWVDNLNPQFLYPEMSKQKEIFATLMQSLSRHLRPAPYPYGLLTLRLLGKLGGKNRRFLREPLALTFADNLRCPVDFECSWRRPDLQIGPAIVKIPLPLDRCLHMLKSIAVSERRRHVCSPSNETPERIRYIRWSEKEELWTCRLSNVDFSLYQADVVEDALLVQAKSSVVIVKQIAQELQRIQSDDKLGSSDMIHIQKATCLALITGSSIPSIGDEAWTLLQSFLPSLGQTAVCESISDALSDQSVEVQEKGIDLLKQVVRKENDDIAVAAELLINNIGQKCSLVPWNRRSGLFRGLLNLLEAMDNSWIREREIVLINTVLQTLKVTPRELSKAATDALAFFIEVCNRLYGSLITTANPGDEYVWDLLSTDDERSADASADRLESDTTQTLQPSDDVVRCFLYELSSSQFLTRFAARIFFNHYHGKSTRVKDEFAVKHVSLIRRALFSRSLRLLPLPQQVGVVEGLASIIRIFPRLLHISDQHLLAFLSELLKMCSVADGEMSDATLKDSAVDKDGYACKTSDELPSLHPSHASALFYRRESVLQVDTIRLVIPEELPPGIQLRVSTVAVLHSVITSDHDQFFDASASTPIGNIRPHVISLLFRSLVSTPLRAVDAAHVALQDVLSLSAATKEHGEGERSKSQSRLPKELLQTCIRPVLLNLREYSRLSIPLLRGLSRLLSLLSSWFNKTLGEKLLEHLQKWTDPNRIISQKLWIEGEEPLVAAAIVDIFALLPNASHFVESLVKTCMKLEGTLLAFKSRQVDSPFRPPLARYLNRYPQSAASFFFPRLKSPIYSELFLSLVRMDECISLREYLSNKQCSVMILNVCFERPLAIIRSEKNTSFNLSGKSLLAIHGIGNTSAPDVDQSNIRPMTTEALELQNQGLHLVMSLLSSMPDYFENHNDIVRAFRWLWRSKGRFLRLQHEDMLPPRFHEESKMLAGFLVSYARSLSEEGLDVLFELIRVFFQPSSSNFGFVGRFLVGMVTEALNQQQRKDILKRFLSLINTDTSEDTKVLSIQFLIFPMLCKQYDTKSKNAENALHERRSGNTDHSADPLIDPNFVEKYVVDVFMKHASSSSFGDRIKVEIMRVLNLLIEFECDKVEPFKKEIVRVCWNVLKSEDSVCKNWAYVVVCRLISNFETPVKIVQQVYTALLRLHQQEGKELVRCALDLLVPALPKRLSEKELQESLDQVTQVLLEDGSSTPQLSIIAQTILRNPGVFYNNRKKFVGYLVNSLNRLGLPPSIPSESRMLSLDTAELLLTWQEESKNEKNPLLREEHLENMINFLVRLKLVTAEPVDGRNSKVEVHEPDSGGKPTKILRRLLKSTKLRVKPQAFEKIMGKEKPVSSLLVSCVELLLLFLESGQNQFFAENTQLVKKLLSLSFECASTDAQLQNPVRQLVSAVTSNTELVEVVVPLLERKAFEAAQDAKKNFPGGRDGTNGRPGTSRGRERAGSTDEYSTVVSSALFTLELIELLCGKRSDLIARLTSSLISLIEVLTKNHLLEATSKQRQGSSHTPSVNAASALSPTPTIGILSSYCVQEPVEPSKIASVKNRHVESENQPCNVVQCILIGLGILEVSRIAYSFSPDRKALFNILNSIIDTSDNLHLLLMSTRVVCSWLNSHESGCPLTSKEISGFLSKLAVLDLSNINNDVISQPLYDLIAQFSLGASSKRQFDLALTKRLLTSSLLHPSARIRDMVFDQYLKLTDILCVEDRKPLVSDVVVRLFQNDYEGLGGRLWTVAIVDAIMWTIPATRNDCIDALRHLSHGDATVSQELLCQLLPTSWQAFSDKAKANFLASVESLVSKPYHSQFLRRTVTTKEDSRTFNSLRSVLNAVSFLRPIPILDTFLMVSLAENHNCWYEVISLLEIEHDVLKTNPYSTTVLSAIRHSFRKLHDKSMWLSLACKSCNKPETLHAISLDMYGLIGESVDAYEQLMTQADDSEGSANPTSFEMELWEERWVELQKDLCQLEAVADFAQTADLPLLQLECAWKSQDWTQVRSLCSSPIVLATAETGDPLLKLCETILAVVDGKLNEVENLHAQTAQLCLYNWQLLPKIHTGSHSHGSLLHFFHRLVEIRESGHIMVETSNHSSGKTLPDLKNLLSAWRHRLPNDWETMDVWDEIFSWRSHMFSAITSNFQWSEPSKLAGLHDHPWTAIRMAKTSRKQGIRNVSFLLLSKAGEEYMNVSDAFLKLREQILAYLNSDSELERHGGLNLINTTNLSFFDASQKSELFRLKGVFLASLGMRSKANQAYCHSVQICPGHARAWSSWGHLCSSLAVVAEKQTEQGTDSERNKEAHQNAAKKVVQYLAQGMACFFEAILIDCDERARILIPKCLWMLTKELPGTTVLCKTLEKEGSGLPAWVWLPWVPQLLTGLYRNEGRYVKGIFSKLVKTFPQAVYYPLRAFYLERRDVERTKSSGASGSSSHHMNSVAFAEEMMSMLRRSHASLWSSLESILEELIVKFRPSHEEELLSTIIALLERAESQVGSIARDDEEDSVVSSVWKTLGRIAAKFFRPVDSGSNKNDDERWKRTNEFKTRFKESFEADFQVTSVDGNSGDQVSKPTGDLDTFLARLRDWKRKLEDHVLSTPRTVSMLKASQSLAMFGQGDPPDLWTGACDPREAGVSGPTRETTFDTDPETSQSSASSSASAARKAAANAAAMVSQAARAEGVAGDYGGGSSCIEIPGQYQPNSSAWADVKPCPELHAKLVKFEPTIDVLRRNDHLVRRVGMIASDGRTYRFLLQFAVPYWTRTDERTSQTNFVLEKILRRNTGTSRESLSLQAHTVVPVAQRLRLISEPESRTSLEDMHRATCLLDGSDYGLLSKLFNDRVKTLADELVGRTEQDRAIAIREGRVKIFREFCTEHQDVSTIFSRHVVSVLNGTEQYYQFRQIFTKQWAMNCLLQYVFSVAERTPSRVVFKQNSGCVLATDFRVSYSNQGYIESNSLPFRLTRNIQYLVGEMLLEASFVPTVARVAAAIDSSNEEMEPILRLLIRDDLSAYYTKSMAKSDSKTQEMERQLADRVSKNVVTILAKFGECRPTFKKDEKPSPIDQNVRNLVETARDPEKLSMMPSSYQAWL